MQVCEHIGTEVVKYLLARPRHGPDLPVLGLPHANVHYQQEHTDERQPLQVAAADELVDGYSNQVGVRQAEGRVEQHQSDTCQCCPAVASKVGAELPDKLPVEILRYILICTFQAVFAPAIALTVCCVRTHPHRDTSCSCSSREACVRASNSSCSRNCRS